MPVKFGITAAFAAIGVFGLTINGGPALAGSQCFKNLDKRPLYIKLIYAKGDTVNMRLQPAEKRRFDNVRNGDAYCYSFDKIEEGDCPNRNTVHLDSCTDPRLTR